MGLGCIDGVIHASKLKIPSNGGDNGKKIHHFPLQGSFLLVDIHINKIRVMTIINIINIKVPAAVEPLLFPGGRCISSAKVKAVIGRKTIVVNRFVLIHTGIGYGALTHIESHIIIYSAGRHGKCVPCSEYKNR